MTAGTIFEGTRKPLRTWFLAMWFVTSQKNGVSALGLQRALGLGSYETGSRGHATRPQSRRLAQTVVVGTLQGGIQHQHLDYYLDEFTFRFNRRRSQARGLLFHRLVRQAAAVGPAPYHSIIKPSISANLAELGE